MISCEHCVIILLSKYKYNPPKSHFAYTDMLYVCVWQV